MSEPAPQVYTATLDPEALEALFVDLALTRVLEVRAKGAPTSRSAELGLSQAQTLLQSGEIRALQVCYIWKDETWIDTLFASPAGTRLTRTRAPAGT